LLTSSIKENDDFLKRKVQVLLKTTSNIKQPMAYHNVLSSSGREFNDVIINPTIKEYYLGQGKRNDLLNIMTSCSERRITPLLNCVERR
jgi:hypothetical protein